MNHIGFLKRSSSSRTFLRQRESLLIVYGSFHIKHFDKSKSTAAKVLNPNSISPDKLKIEGSDIVILDIATSNLQLKIATFNLFNYLEPPNAYYEFERIYSAQQ